MTVGTFVTNSDNPGIIVNLALCSSFNYGPGGLSIIFHTSGGSLRWTFSNTTHATTAYNNLITQVGTTAVAD